MPRPELLQSVHTEAPVMRWEIHYEAANQMIRVKTSGTMTLPSFKRMVAASIAEGAKHHAHRFLMDHRDVVAKLTTAEIYALPAIVKALGREPRHRVAILFSGGTNARDFAFHEFVSKDIEFQQKFFSTSQMAIAWLIEGRPGVAKTH